MRLATSINNMLSVINLQLIRITPSIYDRDGFRSGNNHDFIRDPAFVRAYRRGVKAAGEDYRFRMACTYGALGGFLCTRARW